MANPSTRVEIPADKNGRPIYAITPRGTTLARTVNAAIDISTLIDLDSEATLIKVYAITQDVLLKWADSNTDYCKIDNFDELIRAGSEIEFHIPEKADGTLYPKIQVVSRVAGATVIIWEK